MQSRYRVRPEWLGSILLRGEGPSFFLGWGWGGQLFVIVYFASRGERWREEGVDR